MKYVIFILCSKGYHEVLWFCYCWLLLDLLSRTLNVGIPQSYIPGPLVIHQLTPVHISLTDLNLYFLPAKHLYWNVVKTNVSKFVLILVVFLTHQPVSPLSD